MAAVVLELELAPALELALEVLLLLLLLLLPQPAAMIAVASSAAAPSRPVRAFLVTVSSSNEVSMRYAAALAGVCGPQSSFVARRAPSASALSLDH